MTVKIAAMNTWSISKEAPKVPAIENAAITKSASCAKATIAPKENCHLRNRIKMYKKMAIKAKIMAWKEDALISFATVAPTLEEPVMENCLSPSCALFSTKVNPVTAAIPSFTLLSTSLLEASSSSLIK